MIATFLRLNADRASVNHHGERVRERVLHCATQDDLCDAATDRGVSRVVIDLSDWGTDSTLNLAHTCSQRIHAPEIIALHSSSTAEFAALSELILCIPAIQNIYRAYETNLGRCLLRSPHDWLPPGTTAIMDVLGHGLIGVQRRILLFLVAEAERKATWGRVSPGAGVARARVTEVLAQLGFPTLPAFRVPVRLAHASYRMAVHGATPEVAGTLAGFENGAHSLANYAEEHLGFTLTKLREAGVEGVLKRAKDRLAG